MIKAHEGVASSHPISIHPDQIVCHNIDLNVIEIVDHSQVIKGHSIVPLLRWCLLLLLWKLAMDIYLLIFGSCQQGY